MKDCKKKSLIVFLTNFQKYSFGQDHSTKNMVKVRVNFKGERVLSAIE